MSERMVEANEWARDHLEWPRFRIQLAILESLSLTH